eukprot:Tamp_21904.p2 GENE.Tamp_21904~~Tamp_21904.p2  ORF type:complete len:112 (-),score=4.63 Tamp_21904:656-991(-)
MIKKNKEKRKKKVSTVAASVVTKSIVIRIRKNEIEKKKATGLCLYRSCVCAERKKNEKQTKPLTTTHEKANARKKQFARNKLNLTTNGKKQIKPCSEEKRKKKQYLTRICR